MDRAAMQEYFGEVRAYFAPVDRATETGTVFDPSASFDLEAPPAPWVPLGVVRNFKRVAKSSMGTVRSGAAGVAQSQYRKLTEAQVSLDFAEWGKLQMALAASSQHMNVLESSGGLPRASGGAGNPGQAVMAGSSATLLLLDALALSNYEVGDLVVVDVDYTAGMTELGTGITGGVQPQQANNGLAGGPAATAGPQLDSDAVRRVSYIVGRISAITASGLQLNAPLPGGAPADGAKVQKVVGFVDHEGAGFVQEWSAVFALREVSGGRVYFYYPRLQAAASAEETVAAVASGVNATLLHAEFAAMGCTDANSGERVVGYRSYIPAAGTPAY